MDPEAGPRSADSFLTAQRFSSRRLGFAVTKACPLRCDHCSASAAPELGASTFTADFGRSVARQIPDLHREDVRWIDFTGGEPTLAEAFLRIVGDAAASAGLSCGIVTAAHWAASAAGARRLIARHAAIENWDLSTDVFHLKFVPLSTVRRAFDALQEAGRNVMIRIAYRDELPIEDARLIADVMAFAGRRVGCQPVGPVGRGRNLFEYVPVSRRFLDTGPCPTTGPLVRAEGRVAPCCAPLSHEAFSHPLDLGNGFTDPLTDIVRRWRLNPLLQTIRLWGFAPVLDWIEAAGHVRNFCRHRACHVCTALLADPVAAAIAAARAQAMSHRVKVAFALRQYFDEPWMDEELQQEARTLLQAV
jgi:hypothetical protein